ncbi:phenylalanine--tRNA ligase subunit alpha [Flavobacterium caeni]|uniref:Oxygen tolerance n=1 Tax=Flavobacterium caeni TaxID=490189 RepID=A0A1G5GYH5_9FLAO|nr:hypothetical protein [Flavobacterium caeni]SCY56359.1 hypothetical protein SAMN02927903_01676 [Flavobacterium caeni]
MKKYVYILVLALVSAIGFAQQKKVTTAIDSTRKKIGAEFKLTLKTNVDTLSKVTFPAFKNFGALEVIQEYPTDTIAQGDRYELVKKYGLTQFDSGRYMVPRLPVIINGKPHFSDSIRVEVANVAVDTLKQKMYDIKDIVPVKDEIGDWWIYLLLLIAIGAGGYFLYHYLKKKQALKADEFAYKTPIEKATMLLQTLEKKELWQKGEVKTYYSELTDIARNYIEEAIHIPAMESTTSELIVALRAASVQKKMSLTPETVENLERVLRQADLVKFAKSKPLDFEITEDRNKIEKVIVTLDKAIPQEEEEIDDLAYKKALHEKMLRRQKRNRILATAGFVVLALVGVTAYFVITKGFTYVKDNVIGSQTKELLEGEWVYSEYGDPGVKLETPHVLKRQKSSDAVPKDAMAFLKDMTIFSYGSLAGKFYSMVSTMKFANETELDLNQSYEGVLQTLEMRGAKNIFMKPEEFSTQQGITGIRGYGTMMFLDPIAQKSYKVYCEILLFKQDGGLQQVMVAYEEGDAYGKDILSRIINSVELKKAAP